MNDSLRPRVIRRQATRQIGETRLVLETVGIEARAPFGGVVWNRPAAVITRGPAAETRHPIPDVTRRARFALYGIALLFVLLGLMARGRPPKESTS